VLKVSPQRYGLDFLFFMGCLLLAPLAKFLELYFALNLLLVLGREVVLVFARLAG